MWLALLIISLVLQFVASGLAFVLIRKTGRITAWLFISSALLLIAIRRSISLVHTLTSDSISIDPSAEGVALLISCLMVIGVWLIRSVFDRLNDQRFATQRELSRRIEAEEELSRKDVLLREMGQIAHIGAWEFDPVTGEGTWTEEVARIHDLDPNDETSMDKGLSFYQAESREQIEQALREAIKSGKSYDLELELISAKGLHKWVRTIGSPILEDGKVVSVRGSFQDITERKKVAQEAERNRSLLRSVLDILPNHICAKNLDGRFLLVNKTLTDFYGTTVQEMTGRLHSDICEDEEELKSMLAADREVIEGQNPVFVSEETMQKPDGSIIWLQTIKIPFQANDEPAVLIAALDITERKRAETELIQSKQFIDSVINGIADPIFVKDEKHCWIMVNDAFCRIVGRNRDELLGKSDHDLFPEKEADVFWEQDQLVLSSGKQEVNEENLKVGEQTRIISTSKSSFNNPITGNRNIVGIIRDITDAKHIEEQLQQAQKMESVGRLAGGVAHDFNNMLSVIIGYSQSALEMVSPDDPLHEDISEILKAGNRSAEITRQLLAFARKQIANPREVDLNVNIEGMLKMLRRLIGEDIELAWRPGANLWQVKIDPSQIDQIMANLCVNARDALPNVGKITIETNNTGFDDEYCADHAECIPGDYVMLAVSDNGNGMSSEVLDKIFEPFFTTKSFHKGTGLGLSTVYGIVKQNNGFISVYSEVEKGTTFKIYLPRHTGQKGVKPLSLFQNLSMSKGETILLVEDDKSILKLGVRMLNSLGYTVLPAATPAKAMKIAEENLGKIDLLITDVVMPGMNGRELSEQLQKQDANLKTLYMSGYTANVIAHRGVIDEGVCFIPKPLSKKELSVKIREVLDNVTA